jgi:capsular polysaccharide biosynthesis protein
MKRISFLLIAVAAVASVMAFSARALRPETQAEVPILVTEMPAGYREWRFISVAHEEGNLNSFASFQQRWEAS